MYTGLWDNYSMLMIDFKQVLFFIWGGGGVVNRLKLIYPNITILLVYNVHGWCKTSCEH